MGKTAAAGYTIIEVMIFLAISGSMLAMATASFGGRDADVRFSQSVRDFDSRLRDIMNDISTGYYQTAGTIGCDVATSVGARPVINYTTRPVGGLGTSEKCVFSGKILHFRYSASAPTSDFNIYDVVTRKYVESGALPSSLETARPVIVANSPAPNSLQSGLQVTKIATVGSPNLSLGAFGIFTDANKTSMVNGTSEVETTSVLALSNSTSNQPASGIEALVSAIGGMTAQTDATRVVVCLSDGDPTHKASITLGGNELSTQVDFDAYNKTVCG
jgi:type II secretory pathway pseudopilin PulG